MARLVMPELAIRMYQEGSSESEKGKWHIPKGGLSENVNLGDRCIYAVCDLELLQPYSLGNNIREITKISQVPAKKLCLICLGPIYADDCPS